MEFPIMSNWVVCFGGGEDRLAQFVNVFPTKEKAIEKAVSLLGKDISKIKQNEMSGGEMIYMYTECEGRKEKYVTIAKCTINAKIGM